MNIRNKTHCSQSIFNWLVNCMLSVNICCMVMVIHHGLLMILDKTTQENMNI